MSTLTRIEWTERTWNPVVGCTKVSPGCKHCYAETMAMRLQAMSMKGYVNGFRLTVLPERLSEPLRRKTSTVYSMSDLFHEEVPDTCIRQVFAVMRSAEQHTFQVLTKRTERMARYCSVRPPPPNVWLGVSVEDRRYGVPRISYLRSTAARIRFLSIEPLLEDIGALELLDIHWVIVGGESGAAARPMRPEWVEHISGSVTRRAWLSSSNSGEALARTA